MHTCYLNPYAARRILWAGDRTLFPLQPLACTYAQAADLINDNINNFLHGPHGYPPHDPFQQIKADWNLHQLWNLPKFLKHPWLRGKCMQDVLCLYFDYFNVMIFGGALNSMRYTLEFAEPNEEQARQQILGTTIDNRDYNNTSQHNIRADIKIFVRQPAPKSKEEKVQRLKDYVGTLLHEMIHAFFSVYVCKCSGKCKVKLLHFSENGITGHGEPYMRAAGDIEKFINNDLGLNVRLGREEALGLELVMGGKKISYADLDRLKLSESNVSREMEYYAGLQAKEEETRRTMVEEARQVREEAEKLHNLWVDENRRMREEDERKREIEEQRREEEERKRRFQEMMRETEGRQSSEEVERHRRELVEIWIESQLSSIARREAEEERKMRGQEKREEDEDDEVL